MSWWCLGGVSQPRERPIDAHDSDILTRGPLHNLKIAAVASSIASLRIALNRQLVTSSRLSKHLEKYTPRSVFYLHHIVMGHMAPVTLTTFNYYPLEVTAK